MAWTQKRKNAQRLFKLNEKALKDAGLLTGKTFIKIKNREGRNVLPKRKIDKRSTEYKNIINRYAGEFVPYISQSSVFQPDVFDEYSSIINMLLANRGKSIRFVWEDVNATIDIPLTGSFTNIIKTHFQFDSENSIFDQYAIDNQVDIVPTAQIFEIIDSQRNRLRQSFLDAGVHHCVFEPIKEFYNKKIETGDKVKNKSVIAKARRIIRKCVEMEEKYASGVPEDKMKEVVEYIEVGGIDIMFPFQKSEIYLSVRHSYKQEKIFKFLNTRLNHLENSDLSVSGIFSNNNIVELETLDELYEIKNKLDMENTFYLYKKTKDITTIYTLNAKYTINSEYRKLVNKFEEDYNIDSFKICDIKDKGLSEFVSDSVHYNDVMDFKPKADGTKHIDQKKAYFNYHKCEYLNGGVLGKITDFRQVDEMLKGKDGKLSIPAIYRVNNFNFSGVEIDKLQILIKLNVYHDNNIYTSVELDFLIDIGATFSVIEGCWGTEENLINEIYFPDEFKQKDAHGCPFYSKYAGCCDRHELTDKVFIKGDKKYLDNLQCFIDAKVRYDANNCSEGFVEYKKESNRTFCQFTSFITACVRVTAIQQLFLFDYNNILRVKSDGIYFIGETPELIGTYRIEESDKKWGKGNGYFATNIHHGDSMNIDINDNYISTLPRFRKNYTEELHIGPGGTGKTHMNLLDKGFIKPVYIAPSWKLCASKKEEYGIDAYPKSHLLEADGGFTRNSVNITRNNVWVIDEVSQMSEEELKTIRSINAEFGAKIIYIGDPGYQLPCVSGKGISIESFGKINTVKYTKTFRFQCSRLENILNDIREKIDNHLGGFHILNYVLDSCKDRVIKSEEGLYKINDYILTYTNKIKDKYTDKYKGKFGELEKIMFKRKQDDYFNGTIKILNKDEISSFPVSSREIRHGFTTHCIQGETIQTENKIFIDVARFQKEPRLIYTAMSRARKLEQIYFIK
jgi:hypothetical protein